ncbi:MAG: PLP-dependent aspartate aminotransferase family protein [Bacteroidota bacterium]
MSPAPLHPTTRAAHAGLTVDPETRAVVPPIHLATTFERAPDGSYPAGYQYSRSANPNRATLEAALADLEGGDLDDEIACVAFPSGMAAIFAVLQTLAPGDHVVAPRDAYYNVALLLRDHFARWGVGVSFADMTAPHEVAAAMTPATKLVWIETPSNPLLDITDIEKVATVAHSGGALVACDNTWATPLLQRPLTLGADLVVHATTKYLAGHSDVTGGAVIVRGQTDTVERLQTVQRVAGVVPSPLDCWLVARGLRTLAVRMRAHVENALALAHFLDVHPSVERVHYPGLPNDPGHETAAKQMDDFGGMLSFVVRGGEAKARAVANGLQLFTQATSLGGPESLVEHRASVEGPASLAPPGLLRVSVGLEHPDDLIADLSRVLDP